VANVNKKKQNSIGTSRDENDYVDVWSKIKGQIVLHGIEAETRSKGHWFCGQQNRLRWYGHIFKKG